MVRKGYSMASRGSRFMDSLEQIGWKILPPLPPTTDDLSPLLVKLLPAEPNTTMTQRNLQMTTTVVSSLRVKA